MRGDGRAWLFAALMASLLVNVFLGGVVIGRIVLPGAAAAARPARPVVVQARVRALPLPERVAFGQAWRTHQPEIRAARQRLRKARADAQAAVAAPTYDATAVAARLADVRAAAQAQQTATHAALTEALGRLSPASRRTLVRDTVGNMEPARE